MFSVVLTMVRVSQWEVQLLIAALHWQRITSKLTENQPFVMSQRTLVLLPDLVQMPPAKCLPTLVYVSFQTCQEFSGMRKKNNFPEVWGEGSIIKSANQSGMKSQSLHDIASLHKAFDHYMINMDWYTVPRVVTPSPILVLMIADGLFDVGNVRQTTGPVQWWFI